MIDEFMELIEDNIRETGRELKISGADLRELAGAQMAQLALAAGEPGYGRAVIAARDNVALAIGLEAVARADSIDSKLLGVIQGGLYFGAKVLAGGL